MIRNQIDSVLLEQVGAWWQHLPKSIQINGDLAHQDGLISKQSMGFWLKVVEHFKIYDKVFALDFLDHLDFKRYFHKNRNRFGTKTNLAHRKNAHLKRHEKADLLLQLLRTLRNRAFHFENLYKYTPKGDPRLNAKILEDKHTAYPTPAKQTLKPQELYIALQPDKIALFLEDLLGSFAPELVSYANGGKRFT
ncbi:hypothetical protein NHP190012_16380 (plasmid) [Helicobacter sp. NHP19-012]|uniref:CAAX protease n=1 Tax=Helicobacter gastrofelis TaxID=2849642 RepID=A0ABN6I8S0_9HELI|nr:hypothetical protein [Helicobacter sp. NHP19-012]BCZ19996.1 hypothetical protein NHP190012_16380 [Helicobacter sp. NHP19-012]